MLSISLARELKGRHSHTPFAEAAAPSLESADTLELALPAHARRASPIPTLCRSRDALFRELGYPRTSAFRACTCAKGPSRLRHPVGLASHPARNRNGYPPYVYDRILYVEVDTKCPQSFISL